MLIRLGCVVSKYFPLADLNGHESLDLTPSAYQASEFFRFQAVFGKIWQHRVLAPHGVLAPLPWENAGSATVFVHILPNNRLVLEIVNVDPPLTMSLCIFS